MSSFPTLDRAIELVGAVQRDQTSVLVPVDDQQRQVELLNRREDYRSQVAPDIHPIGVTAKKIEDILSRWLQTVSAASAVHQRLDGRSAREIAAEMIEKGEAAVVRDGDEEQAIRIIAKWMVETYAVWPRDEAKVKGSIHDKDFSVQPLHLLIAHLWPTTAPDFGRILFPLLVVDPDAPDNRDLDLVRSLREYFGRNERLGLFGDLVLQTYADAVDLPTDPDYREACEAFEIPFCVPHARQLQRDVRVLLKTFHESLHRSVLVDWLQNLIATHLALYYLRISLAIQDDVDVFFTALAQINQDQEVHEEALLPKRCSAKCYGDLRSCRYREQMMIPLWLGDGLPPEDAPSGLRPDVDDSVLYNFALNLILINRVRDLMNRYYDADSLWSLRDCVDMLAIDADFHRYLTQASLIQGAHYLDLSDIDVPHRLEKLDHARSHPSGPLYGYLRFVRDDYATVQSRTDRTPSNVGKFYRQLARNQDRGFLGLRSANPRSGAWYYRLHDDLLTLMVHLLSAELRSMPTVFQLEQQLSMVYGLRISETGSGTDPNERALRSRLQALGMFHSVSDAREAQFIEPIFEINGDGE